MDLKRGDLLISYPYLEDNYFFRSVICMLSHDHEGSFGLIFNKKMPNLVGEVVHLLAHLPNHLYMGGPVETDSLFFIHPYSDLKNTIHIRDNLYWNGDLNELRDMFELEFAKPEEVRFFLGYSGWGTEQLESEIKEQSWFIGEYNEDLITSNDDDDIIWRKSIELLGSEFKDIARFPIDPSLN